MVLTTAGAIFRGIYQAGAEKGDVYGLSWYINWHHRDGGVHKGADGRRGEDDVRDGVVDCEEEMMRPARKRKTEM
jgi:hypothetical protein